MASCAVRSRRLVSSRILIYPPETSHLTPIATKLMAADLASAVGLVVYLSGTRAFPVRRPFLLHRTDIFMAAAVPLFLGIFSPISVLLIYPLLAGAYRWGVPVALLTAVVVEMSVVAYGLLVTWPLAGPGVGMTTLVLHTISIPVIGGVAVYLAHIERQREHEAIDLATVLRSARTSGEFDQTVALVLGSFIKMFGAAQIILVISDRKTGGTFLWRAEAADEGLSANENLELRPEQQPDYLFDLQGAACCYIDRRRRRVDLFDVSGLAACIWEGCAKVRTDSCVGTHSTAWCVSSSSPMRHGPDGSSCSSHGASRGRRRRSTR